MAKMGLELGLWRVDNKRVNRVSPSDVALERDLEDYIESDPDLLGEKLLIIGRQVPTPHSGPIDLLALDDAGTVHVIELKRGKTPRDVTAQILDYGSWIAELERDDIQNIYQNYAVKTALNNQNTGEAKALEEVFDERFGEMLPEEINAAQKFTIVASSFDAATERIVKFLNTKYDVPLNVIFFKHFKDNGATYLAHSWLINEQRSAKATNKNERTKEPWNNRDWYVSFGGHEEAKTGRNWDDALQYNFVSAGGGEWYSRTLKNPQIGHRVFVYLPKKGYVGVGEVTGPAVPFSEAKVEVNGQELLLSEQTLQGEYLRDGGPEKSELVLPVKWIAARPRQRAFWKPGMYANQNTATKLRQQFTIDQVTKEFGIEK